MPRDKRKMALSWTEADELSYDEVKAFVNNAQVALANEKVSGERLNYLVAYATNLEDVLLESTLTKDELAYILVSTAYHVLYGNGRRRV